MASKPAMDGKQRGQVRATIKEDKQEQQVRATSQKIKTEQQARATSEEDRQEQQRTSQTQTPIKPYKELATSSLIMSVITTISPTSNVNGNRISKVRSRILRVFDSVGVFPRYRQLS